MLIPVSHEVIPVPMQITLASTSDIRQRLLAAAHVPFRAQSSSFDETPVKDSMVQERASPRSISLELADGKAKAVSLKTEGLVIGCDQVLAFDGRILSKPKTIEDARQQLTDLRGTSHTLLSAAVIYEDGTPVWSHVGEVTLMMRDFSNAFLRAYLDRNWPGIQSSVGAYKLEEEGVRLFSKIDGDYFTVLGMPLVEILGYLGQRGVLEV